MPPVRYTLYLDDRILPVPSRSAATAIRAAACLFTHLSVLMVDHDIVRFDVAVHDPLGVAEIERFEEFKHVIPHVEICEFGVERFEVGVLPSVTELNVDQSPTLTYSETMEGVLDCRQRSHVQAVDALGDL